MLWNLPPWSDPLGNLSIICPCSQLRFNLTWKTWSLCECCAAVLCSVWPWMDGIPAVDHCKYARSSLALFLNPAHNGFHRCPLNWGGRQRETHPALLQGQFFIHILVALDECPKEKYSTAVTHKAEKRENHSREGNLCENSGCVFLDTENK